MNVAAHDPYADDELAALYDLDCAGYDDDLDMYAQFAARGDGSVLELGAGTGRVALQLARTQYTARAGHRVTALDASAAMLARLESRLDDTTPGRVEAVRGDMRTFSLGARFGLICCPLFGFEHLLTTDEQLSALRCVAAHLSPGGVFVAELRTLGAIDWSQTGEAPLVHAWTRADPATGDTVTKLASLRASPAGQTTTATMIFDRAPSGGGPLRRRQFDVTLRVTPRAELALLLDAAGLRLAQTYGGADLSPYGDGSDSMIAVAERASER